MNPHNHAISQPGISMSRYTVFDGIDLIFLDVKRETIQFFAQSHTKTFAINHCEEGRIECKFTSGEYLYMGAGDMSLGWHTHSDYQHENYFPTKFFKGIVLLVDVEKAQPVLDSLVTDSRIDLTDLANRFCENSDFGMMVEETESVRQIFSSLYTVPDQIKGHYFRLKVIEIFLLLSVISTENCERRSTFRKQQVDIVKSVSRYMSTYFMKRITIDELANSFNIPSSTLKRCFKGVYGVTIHQFLKECRINEAKRLLRDTDEPILRIANAVGYENGSKFTSAFKEAVGMKPSDYRKI
ncbi:AraC family transcriptional regulator [Veillonella denticariosi JCM 15641]|uniref:AraC family transcriptional regulator n=1 Tax=Veillonella denticariosi JCM 15641 TaxID=1298594 RepID=A0A2S7Z8I2_9FIRM|nr:AraC family transcriptional regulator [Veillonella denticariosi]PQL19505.1 AraC family transcriptional regulator [Veillonella denticariosi JCM 15641]